ncbi:DUF4158 domain-containing protein [Streptomyces sp. NRRL S-87]|uniref:DUF4158 domain-containing protein n=1 Tax=Streptomyces sp. NRRL S-87 TaxID=1463920 RepID=UPI00068A45AB|nr:DUF4158 domain-containing protein [Streptomyces sp. NRRL S-87]
MRQDWEPEDLIEVWMLLEDDMKRVRNKSGTTRLGFAVQICTVCYIGRFLEEDPLAVAWEVVVAVSTRTGSGTTSVDLLRSVTGDGPGGVRR